MLLDLVAEVPSRDGPDEVILVHVEVEREFGRAMDRRMWRYFAHLSVKHDRPVLPIALFLRGGPGGVTRRTYEQRIFAATIHRFAYWSFGLSASKASTLLAHPPLGVALASCARGDRLERHAQKILCMEALIESMANDAQKQLLMTAIETYLELNEEQQMKYADKMSESPYKVEMRQAELTWAGQLHARGLEEGVERGAEIGRLEGSVDTGRRMVLKILSRRFGEVRESLVERLGRIDDLAAIEALGDEALTASTLADFESRLPG